MSLDAKGRRAWRYASQLGSFGRLMLASPFSDPALASDPARLRVLLLCGWGTTPGTMSLMARRLAADGFAPLIFDHCGLFGRINTESVERLAARVHMQIESLCTADPRRVAIVGHSLGGIVGRCLISRPDGAARVQTLITLGSPHRGSPLAALLARTPVGRLSPGLREICPGSELLQHLAAQPLPPEVEVVSIYSEADRHCPRPAAELELSGEDRHARNISAGEVGHEALVVDEGVYALILQALSAR